jgi:hypothetical protein
MDENFNASFSDLVQFQGTSFEVWGARDEAIDEPARLEVTGGTEQKMTTEEETSP